MKSDGKILIAFILNLFFSIFELVGGFITKSVAILSDSVHDLGDALSIGISYFLEKKSKKKPDNKYTYGYLRYSILGALITTLILIIGGVGVIYGAIIRLFNPVKVNYDGMIVFALFGVIINFLAAYVTRDKSSLNQRAVNLHMLEDVLGWIVVLIGSIVIKFTHFSQIDAIMSILVSLFILYNAFINIKNIGDLFLEKIPKGIDVEEIKKHLSKINGIIDVHHVHVWSIDGENNYATIHIVSNSKDTIKLKKEIREELNEHNISHVTIEIETEEEKCSQVSCEVKKTGKSVGHHH